MSYVILTEVKGARESGIWFLCFNPAEYKDTSRSGMGAGCSMESGGSAKEKSRTRPWEQVKRFRLSHVRPDSKRPM
jgi:hypothetical protein